MTSASSADQFQADFDRIALLPTDRWDHNIHYHYHLLKHVPTHCVEALDIGCGTGAFSRLLAQRSERVLALDLSPQMIRIARESSGRYANINFQVSDASTWLFPVERFDCVASIATLHHLPFGEMLAKIKRSLKVNGTLLVLDLYQDEVLSDGLVSRLSVPLDIAFRLLYLHRLGGPSDRRRAWAEHRHHESYLTMSQIRRACASTLPGAKVRRLPLWRYSLVWRKSA